MLTALRRDVRQKVPVNNILLFTSVNNAKNKATCLRRLFTNNYLYQSSLLMGGCAATTFTVRRLPVTA